nr:uncharacterized protein LOC113740812 [Coffea arabica]
MVRIAEARKMRSLGSSYACLEFLSYQSLQRCLVSGTAKGKSKIKGSQPLKRSKVTTNKGTGSGDSNQKEGGPRKKSEFDELVDECLALTSPIRFLKHKEKAREAEREKMGLKSKGSDYAGLAKKYSRVLMRKHRARQAAESAFLRCKKEAIEALPEGLKAAALVPNLTPFPAN